jgi:hypothetical protein
MAMKKLIAMSVLMLMLFAGAFTQSSNGACVQETKEDQNWDHVCDAALTKALLGVEGACSQANYSVSIFGTVSSGITEGRGKTLVSVVGYRYYPDAANGGRIPQAFYDKIQEMLKLVQQNEEGFQRISLAEETEMYFEIFEEKPSVTIQEQYPELDKEPFVVDLKDVPPPAVKKICTPIVKEKQTAVHKMKRPGIKVSRELFEMAGFPEHLQIHNLTIK